MWRKDNGGATKKELDKASAAAYSAAYFAYSAARNACQLRQKEALIDLIMRELNDEL